MDRVVKIWRIHDYEGQLLREDKPLYSSTLVHRSSVASVVWYVALSDRVYPFQRFNQAIPRYPPHSLHLHTLLEPHRFIKGTTRTGRR
jgi:hypothetical protein